MVGWPTVKAILGNAVAPGSLDRYLADTGYDAQQTDEPRATRAGRTTCSSRSTATGRARAVRRPREAKLLQLWATKHRVALGAAAGAAALTHRSDHHSHRREEVSQLVADFILERLREWGVHRIYGYPGDGINGILGALDRADGDPEFDPGAPRGDGRVHGLRPREVHRRGRRLPRHLRARARSTC